jgi:predicted Zn-dependent protease
MPDMPEPNKAIRSPDRVVFVPTASRSPALTGYWLEPPNIKICDRVVSISKAQRAIRFWERLGYQFGEITHETNIMNCRPTAGKIGEIVIQLPTARISMDDNLALTKTYRETTTNINLRAEIFITPFAAEKLLTLEHEIGHALGWSHVNSSYHLMNPEWRHIGHNSRGLHHRLYLTESQRLRALSQE